MAIIKCKMCGGDIDISTDRTYGTCEFCGCQLTLPRIGDEQRVACFNRGNHFRRIGEYDKALSIYEHLIQEDDNDAEAHWCCALSRFGIEYVEDPITYEWIPTCHRVSFDSFLEDVDYLAALEHSDGVAKRQYMKDAAKIAQVQHGILAASQNEDPYDIFICYKEMDECKQRTQDSVIAQDIYYKLTEQGYRVFFSRISLEKVVGKEYEPYIFAALNTAKVMLVIGTKPEFLNSVWVKNEWNRFLSMMRNDHDKVLLPCYRDMDPYDLPEQLSVLQSYDMSKIGFTQDLSRGISKVLGTKDHQSTILEPIPTTESLLRRAALYLEDREWDSADEYCERVLDMEPENGLAYLYELMSQYECATEADLKNCSAPINTNNLYEKVMRFGTPKQKTYLDECSQTIEERLENKKLNELYTQAQNQMDSAASEADYRTAADLFSNLTKYNDAEVKMQQCLEKAEETRKNSIYKKALICASRNSLEDLAHAVELFAQIPGWRNVDVESVTCQSRLAELEKIQKDLIEQKRINKIESERKRHEKNERAKKIKQLKKQITHINKELTTQSEIVNNLLYELGLQKKEIIETDIDQFLFLYPQITKLNIEHSNIFDNGASFDISEEDINAVRSVSEHCARTFGQVERLQKKTNDDRLTQDSNDAQHKGAIYSSCADVGEAAMKEIIAFAVNLPSEASSMDSPEISDELLRLERNIQKAENRLQLGSALAEQIQNLKYLLNQYHNLLSHCTGSLDTVISHKREVILGKFNKDEIRLIGLTGSVAQIMAQMLSVPLISDDQTTISTQLATLLPHAQSRYDRLEQVHTVVFEKLGTIIPTPPKSVLYVLRLQKSQKRRRIFVSISDIVWNIIAIGLTILAVKFLKNVYNAPRAILLIGAGLVSLLTIREYSPHAIFRFMHHVVPLLLIWGGMELFYHHCRDWICTEYVIRNCVIVVLIGFTIAALVSNCLSQVMHFIATVFFSAGGMSLAVLVFYMMYSWLNLSWLVSITISEVILASSLATALYISVLED